MSNTKRQIPDNFLQTLRVVQGSLSRAQGDVATAQVAWNAASSAFYTAQGLDAEANVVLNLDEGTYTVEEAPKKATPKARATKGRRKAPAKKGPSKRARKTT